MLGSWLVACSVGPDYVRAPAPVAEKYKGLKGWKLATPIDTIERGPWWSVYNDSRLDRLAQQIKISNQSVAAAAAAYENARAIIRQAQASLFPIMSASYGTIRTHQGSAVSGITGTSPSSTTTTYYNPQGNFSWDLDVWGKIRRQIESNTSGAQASAADLAAVELAAQGQLAIAYFNLKSADSLKSLLDRTIIEYQRTLKVAQDQAKTGTVTRADVAQEEMQLMTAQSQALNVGIQRAQFEDAIAVLIGRPPAELTIAKGFLARRVPKIPVAVPSSLLERRPDIAVAERRMQQQNALIGVAIAAYFPDISITASGGFIGGTPFPFNASNLVWSLGAAASDTVFDGGLRGAQVDAARANYWESIANYRQTVLTAFQQVEDQLAAIRILTEQLQVAEGAVKEGRIVVDVYTDQYRTGTITITILSVAQERLLAAEQAALALRQSLFVASVNLIVALGGGWDASLVPTAAELSKAISLLPQL